ncbi:type II secretion system F family protein [Clostridium brassicae]|uniref:Type II secretion system F family protein n=1 Tax=Clostridium brassicae TaxID=2999072 RepID=A0ABT4DAG7_9CLOT|nr:type II secretion system F family protein [Clostridium brassicae]MCY6959302.1 type II secretion system F family protein [Clostridium brassicae]
MPLFKYEAMNKKGEKIHGEFIANNKSEVLAMIRENNYYPILVQEKSSKKEIEFSLKLKKVKAKDLAIFCRQLCTLLQAGMDILNSINVLKKQTENSKMRKSLQVVYEEIQKGVSLSQSLKKFEDVYPPLLINMIEAGEETGRLDVIIERMSKHYERENKINNKLKIALVYPIILIIASITVVTFLLTYVMPTFISMFEGNNVELPGPTKVIIAMSNGIKLYWYLILLFIIIIILIIRSLLKRENGKIKFDSIKLKMPLIGNTFIKIISARFTRGLATVLSSGITMISAIEIVSKILGNSLVEKQLMNSREKVVKGITLGEAIGNIESLPPMVNAMIKIGEESGALDEVLDKTADFYEEEVEQALTKMTAIIEPILILIMGLIIGFIVIAMVMPMFDMYNAI